VIASIDAKGVGQVVRELHPLLESAYHKLGYPDRSFDQVAAKALQRIIRRAGGREDAPCWSQRSELRLRGREAGRAGSNREAAAADGAAEHEAHPGQGREIASALDYRLRALIRSQASQSIVRKPSNRAAGASIRLLEL